MAIIHHIIYIYIYISVTARSGPLLFGAGLVVNRNAQRAYVRAYVGTYIFFHSPSNGAIKKIGYHQSSHGGRRVLSEGHA